MVDRSPERIAPSALSPVPPAGEVSPRLLGLRPQEGVEAEGAARGCGGGVPSVAGSIAGLTLLPAGAPSPRTARFAAAKTRRGGWERSRRSHPTPPRSGRQAGHAQCGHRAAVRQLGSSSLRAENAGGGERRHQAAANFAAAPAVWRDTHLATSNLIPVPYLSDGGCGHRQSVPAARPCLAASWGEPTGKLLGVGSGTRGGQGRPGVPSRLRARCVRRCSRPSLLTPGGPGKG